MKGKKYQALFFFFITQLKVNKINFSQIMGIFGNCDLNILKFIIIELNQWANVIILSPFQIKPFSPKYTISLIIWNMVFINKVNLNWSKINYVIHIFNHLNLLTSWNKTLNISGLYVKCLVLLKDQWNYKISTHTLDGIIIRIWVVFLTFSLQCV